MRSGRVIQRCHNKNSQVEDVIRDVSDVTNRKRGLRFDKKSVNWVPAWEEEGWLTGLVVARRICALRAPRVSRVESWRCKSSQHRRIVSLSPNVEKPFKSKLIKSFVPELRSRKCFFFFVFRDSYVFYIWVMNILCTFHISVSWVCYIKIKKVFQSKIKAKTKKTKRKCISFKRRKVIFKIKVWRKLTVTAKKKKVFKIICVRACKYLRHTT